MTGAETAPAGRTPALRSREIVNSRSSSLPPDARADQLRGRGDLGLGGESLPCMRGAHVDAARGHGRLVFHRGEAVRTATAAPVHVRPRPKALPPKPPLLARTTRRAFAIAAWCSPSGSCCSSAAASPRHISALFLSNDFADGLRPARQRSSSAVSATPATANTCSSSRRVGHLRRRRALSYRRRLAAPSQRSVGAGRPVARPGPHLFYATVVAQLDLAHAKADTTVLRRAPRMPGGVRA